MFKLVSFIEYVGWLPSKNSMRVRAHYIGYRCIHHTWIWNYDEWCHIMDVNGNYKINMAFYCRMASQTVDEFQIEEEGILRWRKSVVIRGVYKSPPKDKGRGWGRGRGHRGRGRGSSAVNSSQKGLTKLNNDDTPDEENGKKTRDVGDDQDNDNDENTASTAEKDLTKDDFLIYGDSSSEDESSNESGKKCLFKLISYWSLLLKSPVEVSYWSLLLKSLIEDSLFWKNVDFNKNCIELSENILEYMPNLPSATPSTRTFYYETRTASRTRQSLGSNTRHLALDNKGAPFVINPACKTIFTQIDITWNCWRQLWIILIAFQTIYAVIRGRPRGWLRGRRGRSLRSSATPAKISASISPSSSEKGYVYCYCLSCKFFHIS